MRDVDARVSIVLCVKNEAARIVDGIANLRGAAPDAELIGVDNDSSDGSAALLAELTDTFVQIHGPLPLARKGGAALARRELILFLDADQRLGPHTLQQAILRLDDTGADAVVLPERPLQTSGLLMKTLAAEREVSELGGVGIPRLIRRSSYALAQPHHGTGWFGDDWALRLDGLAPLSDSPIFHDEPARLRLLLRKYYRYGRMPHLGLSLSERSGGFVRGWIRALLENRITLVAAVLVLLLKVVKLISYQVGAAIRLIAPPVRQLP